MRNNQKKALDKIFKYNKNFLFWSRRSGKSTMISYYLEHLLTYNSEIDILFFVNNNDMIKNVRKKILDDLNHLINNHTSAKIYFKNKNFLTFCSINDDYNYFLHYLKPEVIIFDEFYIYNLEKIAILDSYIKQKNCKFIFTSTNFDIKLINIIDSNNDCYINLLSPFEIMMDSNVYNESGVISVLSYKKRELLDYDFVSYKRMIKLKNLNKIASESEL